jgi:hypothetical protein
MPTIIDGMMTYSIDEAKELFDKRVEENIQKWETQLHKV